MARLWTIKVLVDGHWETSGEGAWDTKGQAQRFGDAEVGLPWKIEPVSEARMRAIDALSPEVVAYFQRNQPSNYDRNDWKRGLAAAPYDTFRRLVQEARSKARR
jgi:hypothetical protein